MAKAKAKVQADGKVQARVLCATEINGTTYKPNSVVELDPEVAGQYGDSLDTNEAAVAYALSQGAEVADPFAALEEA
jgi:hypothetical protein